MEYVDPRTITGQDWPGLQLLVYLLWGFVIFNVGFAFFMLFGHAIIPSLIATGHLPRRFHNIRPIIYVVGVGIFLAAVVLISSWVFNLTTVYQVYPKRLL